MRITMLLKSLLIMALLLGSVKKLQAAEVENLAGTWKGALAVSGQSIPLLFHMVIKEGNIEATLDSPAQGATGIPVTQVRLQEDRVYIDIAAAQAVFEGELSDSNSVLEGVWKQGPNQLPLQLTKVQQTAQASRAVIRPQHPTPPYPYTEQEVSFNNTTAGIPLAGTLTIPAGGGPFPAVVMITGSGPQDRDQTFMGHKTFWVIADHLARHGIAVLRYDDRGVSQSGGDFSTATSVDFAHDASAAVNYLSSHPHIRADQIGLLGHSEGGLVAPIAADLNQNVAFIVSLAGPGLVGNDIAITQIRDALVALGLTAKAAEAGSNITRQLNETIMANTDKSQLKEELRQTYTNAWQALPEDIAGEIEAIGGGSLSQGRLAQLTTNWTRYFLSHDPKPYLRKLTIPVLAIHGSKDTQLNATVNLDIFREQLADKGDVRNEVRLYRGLNHLFQPAATGAMSEYVNIETTIAVQVLEKLASWIQMITQE